MRRETERDKGKKEKRKRDRETERETERERDRKRERQRERQREYGGPEGCSSRTFPPQTVLHKHSPCERFLVNVPLANTSSFTNVLSHFALCEHSITNILSIVESFSSASL